mmetsp:Transcript_846/g.1258  ORF Transcript_846/g.1258 Transcript_846/m.1258 type:complete len:112 (+) Transcript_846:186-521(+)|eukprot:CAMPEP_0184515218 /NCGR_PEP_ID=MMETSP0198_2-20121128/4380_1 /TAXON_ID=1112570 /ORGANISM="Thraustochytrium sp., Strain LLF1b" /LENGTH=111 /DNA_ID=CAMNT_0026905461 /DNA_START=171 /DNA_END=506 /DNA_ORIENTATION=+
MRYIAAYVLLALGGKENPTQDDIKAFLEKVGVEVEADKLAALSTAVEGKTVDELIEAGKEKMKSVAGSSSGGAGGAAGGDDAAAEEAVEEEAAEDVDVGGGDLFGGGGDGY